MSKTYHNLSNLIEPDIFDINKEQKHLLNRFIHLASCTWCAQEIGLYPELSNLLA